RPIDDAIGNMIAVQSRYRDCEATRDILPFRWALCLPFVSDADWARRGFQDPAPRGVLLKQDLKPGYLLDALAALPVTADSAPQPGSESPGLQGILVGEIVKPEPRPIPKGTPPPSPLRLIRELEERFASLDREQAPLAFQTPDGPQRLRGLAGTGKTLVLAKR